MFSYLTSVMRRLGALALLISVLLFFGWDIIGSGLARYQIPKNFVVARQLYYESRFDCQIVVYEIESFNLDNYSSNNTKFKSLYYGKSLTETLDDNISVDRLFTGVTALAGKSCINDDNIKKDYLDTLGGMKTYFSLNKNSNGLLAYNSETKILYFAGRD